MLRILMTASAITLGLATSSFALVWNEQNTLFDNGETFAEESREFIGVPVVGRHGGEIGTVVAVNPLPGNDRQIIVDLNDELSDVVSGWIFEMDGKWETDGVIRMAETADQIASNLEIIALTDPTALHEKSILDQ